MRKNITIVILIGVLSWIPIVSQAQHHDDDNSAVKTVKGLVKDHNSYWDFVTFGLMGSASYEVVEVNLLDKWGVCFASVYDLDGNPSHGVLWFVINFGEFQKKIKVSESFQLEIRLIKRDGSNSGGSTIMLSSLSKIGRSIVPDETVVIIKYP